MNRTIAFCCWIGLAGAFAAPLKGQSIYLDKPLQQVEGPRKNVATQADTITQPGAISNQNGLFTGSVFIEDQPVEMANVALRGMGSVWQTYTNEEGLFHFTGLADGTYQLEISYLGYQKVKEAITLGGDQQLERDFTMQADWLNLDQVVVTGTRTEVPIYESPVIVNEISKETFEFTQALSLSEGLNFSPGLRVENNCQNCGFTQLRMNGLEGAYSQILINSRPIFSALAGVYALDMFPANMVDRIEVVKGGGSVLFGGNAIAGTVNIITKEPITNSFEVGFNQSLIDLDASDRTFSLNGSIVGKDFNEGISLYGYNRNRDHWDANDDGFSEITELRNSTFGFDAFINTSDRGKIKLNGHSITEFRRGGSDFDLEPHQSRIAEQLDHQILGGGLTFEQYSKNYKHKIALYGSLQHTRRKSYYGGGGRVLGPQDSITEADLLAINAYGQSTDLAGVGGLQYTFQIDDALTLILGSEYQLSDVLDEMPGYGRVIDQQVNTIGNFVQLDWNPIEKLSFLIGGRFDFVNIRGRYDLEGESFNNENTLPVAVPRITGMFDFTESLKLRASFAQGYRAPQAFDEDLHIETVGGAARFIQLDPELETERSNNLNLSLNYTKAVGTTQMNLVIEGFYTRLNNPFILAEPEELPSGVSVITKRNGDGAVVQGINVEADFAFIKKIILQMGATFQSARFSSPEVIWSPESENDPTPPTVTENLLRNPNTYGYITLNYKPIEALSLSFSGNYTGPMDVPHVINPDNEFTIIERTPTFVEANLKAAYTFTFNNNFFIELNGGVQNIFNSYQDSFDVGPDRDSGFIFGPIRPRTVFFGLKFGSN